MVLEMDSTKYVCDVCHTSYENKWEAEECEKRDNKEKKLENLERVKEFTITKDHLKLLRSMFVGWDDCEYGAPRIDPKRPYGNSDVSNDIAEMINFPKKGNWDKEEEMWNEKAEEELYYLHKQIKVVLQIVLVTGKFEEGEYVKKSTYDDLSWELTHKSKKEAEQ